MHKIEKIGIVCFIVGIIVVTIGFTMADFRLENLNTAEKKEYTNKEYTSDIKKIKTIVIDTRDCEVQVEPIDGDELKIAYQETKDETYTIKEREDFVIKKEEHSILSNGIAFNWMSFDTSEKEKMHVYIPKTYTGDLEIISSYAPIMIGDFENLGEVSLTNNKDDIHVSNVKAKSTDVRIAYGTLTGNNLSMKEKINIDVDHGELTLNQVEAMNMSIDSGYSSLQVEDLKIQETLNATTNKGGITARNVSAKNIDLSQTYGNFKLYDIMASNEFKFQGEHGDMEMEDVVTKDFKGEGSYADFTFKRVDITNFDLQMYQGNTTGSVIGKMDDFNIKATVEYGNKNLPDYFSEQHPKQLFVEASYGDVNITFDK